MRFTLQRNSGLLACSAVEPKKQRDCRESDGYRSTDAALILHGDVQSGQSCINFSISQQCKCPVCGAEKLLARSLFATHVNAHSSGFCSSVIRDIDPAPRLNVSTRNFGQVTDYFRTVPHRAAKKQSLRIAIAYHHVFHAQFCSPGRLLWLVPFSYSSDPYASFRAAILCLACALSEGERQPTTYSDADY